MSQPRFEAKVALATSVADAVVNLVTAGFKLSCTTRQTDSFYESKVGFLKVRESKEGCALLQYIRDSAGVTTTQYTVLSTGQAATMKAALALSNGLRVVVSKDRLAFGKTLDDGSVVEAHVDSVDGLGDFIEVEAWGLSGESERDAFRTLFGATEEHRTYADMILSQDAAVFRDIEVRDEEDLKEALVLAGSVISAGDSDAESVAEAEAFLLGFAKVCARMGVSLDDLLASRSEESVHYLVETATPLFGDQYDFQAELSLAYSLATAIWHLDGAMRPGPLKPMDEAIKALCQEAGAEKIRANWALQVSPVAFVLPALCG